MGEKEKMLTGELYDANYNVQLEKERIQAKDLCYENNKIKPSNLQKREKIITKLLGKTKERFRIEQPFLCDYGYNIEIGNNVWIGGNVVVLPGVKIGDNTVIGAGSVVTKDIPANVVAVGNPCEVIKNIGKTLEKNE